MFVTHQANVFFVTRIKRVYGTNKNEVKMQIWIAVCTYVLIAIAKKRLLLPNTAIR
jgi:hypothetical protein